MNNNKVDISVLSSLDKCQSFDNKVNIPVKSSPNQSNSFAKNNSLGTQGKATSRSQTKRPSKFGLISLLVLGLTGVLTFEPMIGQIPAAQAQAVPAAARRGFTLLQQGLVNDAIAAFKQAIANSPQSLDAKLGLAQAYQKAGKDSEAWSAYQQVLAQSPNNQPALKAVGLLGSYRQEWQVKGIDALTTLLKLTPNDISSRAARGLLLGYQGRYSEAFADYQIALQNPTPDTLLGAAQIYTFSGDAKQGLEFFKRYQATGKTIPIYQVAAYGRALRETGSVSQAIQVLKQALSQSGKFPGTEIDIRSALAQAYAANRQVPKALAVLEPLRSKKDGTLALARSLTTIGRSEGDTQLYREGAALYRQILGSSSEASQSLVREAADVLSELPEERAAALVLYKQLIAVQPDNKTLLVKQLLLESQLGQISDADLASRLLPALQPLPTDAAELRSLGLGLAQLDPPNPVLLSVYQNLLSSNVDAPFLNFRVAQIFLQQNQLAEAKSALAAYKATASGADDLAPDLLLADIQRREGNLDASAQTYEALIARNQIGDDLLNGALRGLAGVRLAQGQPDQAIALYDQLLQRNPNDLRTALGRATIAYQAKRINQTDAEAVLNRWLSTEPATNTPPELINLVGTLPPAPEREALYTALLAVAPNDVPLQLRQLQVLAVRDPQGAKDRVAQLIARNPDNIGAYFVQGELAQNLGDLELASLAYSGILAKQPNNIDALAALAGVRFEQRKFVAATGLYNQILAINPKNLLARRALAELSLAQDQPFTALERFKQLQQEQLVSLSNPEFVNRVQRLEVDILKRRGFQPYWERF
ncbi:MAG: tetratricopeptide repeat protein [Coleofasciculaceae cyanobacterium]